MEQFIEKMNEVLDGDDEVTMDTVLEDLIWWDSLSFVSFLAMANTTYGVKVSPDDVKAAKTISDLYDLIK